jgi:glutaconyl-CoA/methylmalonyl-CoA decarboxylase subunit gamma
MIRKLRVTVDGITYDVTVEIPDDAAAGLPVASPSVLPSAPLIAPPVITPAATAPPPSPSPSAAPAGPSGPGDVVSPLTGRVTAVIVTVGQDVKEGDHLLTLEAMKMNTFVFAPKSGKVADLKVAVGDAVEEHQILMRVQ